MSQPWRLFRWFSSFRTNITIFTTNWCEKYPSGIWCWDSNARPSEHESPPITTRPGLKYFFVGKAIKRYFPNKGSKFRLYFWWLDRMSSKWIGWTVVWLKIVRFLAQPIWLIHAFGQHTFGQFALVILLVNRKFVVIGSYLSKSLIPWIVQGGSKHLIMLLYDLCYSLTFLTVVKIRLKYYCLNITVVQL